MSEEYKCKGCQYHIETYSEALKENVHACLYTSKTTAWACVHKEKGDSYGSMHMGEDERKVQD